MQRKRKNDYRIIMINEKQVSKYCIYSQIHLIENYTEAINDETQVWD